MNDFLRTPVTPSVADLRKDDRFEGFLLVRAAEKRTGSNGSAYLDLTLADQSGDINAKVWNTAQEPPVPGGVVKVRGSVTEYNGRLQFRVERMRDADESDNFDLSSLIACAPETPEKMMAIVDDTVDNMKNETLRLVVKQMLGDLREKLLYYPAAQRLHHAERAGLLHHTTSMLKVADAMLPCYPFLDGDLLRAGVIVHDLGKILEMNSDKFGNVNDYTKDGLLLGHLVRGVSRVRRAAEACNISDDDEYLLLLEHMILSHHGEAEYGSSRPPMFPEAEMLHFIDVIDARMNEMHGILNRTPEGVFSEKIWSLDRRIYHPIYRNGASRLDETR